MTTNGAPPPKRARPVATSPPPPRRRETRETWEIKPLEKKDDVTGEVLTGWLIVLKVFGL